MKEARAWLAQARGVPTALPTEDVASKANGVSFLGIKLGGLANLLFSQTLMLDGALSLWQP
jgi:hypothetical protein